MGKENNAYLQSLRTGTRTASNQCVDIPFGNPTFLSKLARRLARRVAQAYLQNFSLRKLIVTRPRSWVRRCSTLLKAVSNIVTLGSQEQVIWVYARRVITGWAVVQYANFIRNGSAVDYVGKSMGVNSGGPVPRDQIDLSIALDGFFALPNPAVSRVEYLVGKSLLKCYLVGGHNRNLQFLLFSGRDERLLRLSRPFLCGTV